MTDRTYQGFSRASGSPGVRNHVLILSLSGLENAAARAIQALHPSVLLVSSTYGRGHVGEDLRFQRAAVKALATHPNVGGAVVLGPDDNIVNEVALEVVAAGRFCEGLSLQSCLEDRYTLIERGARAVARLLHQTSRHQREPQPISTLAIAIECGHSDATSGIVANPLVGEFATWLVGGGGRAVFSETLEWIGAESILTERTAGPEIAQDILAAIDRRKEIARLAGADVQANNPGPQNHAGGITTLEEKSLGAIAKGGVQPIVGLLRQGDRLPGERGLYLMDTPCFSPESITSMIAAGCQIALFTTGQGNPYGSTLAPTIKVSANPDTTRRLVEQIDIDASAVLEGRSRPGELLPELRRSVVEIASGGLTWCEATGEGAESLSRLGPSI
ncbi:MAG: UxaA family hydrolase [Hyphomicrobiaceae bacterium]